MPKKKVDPKFAIIEEQKPKIPKFPVHENDKPYVTRKLDEHTIVSEPSDRFCAVKVKGFYADGSGIYAYEIVAKEFEQVNMTQWAKGRKWVLVGYINPFSYIARFNTTTQFLTESIPALINDIKLHESVLKEIIANGGTV